MGEIYGRHKRSHYFSRAERFKMSLSDYFIHLVSFRSLTHSLLLTICSENKIPKGTTKIVKRLYPSACLHKKRISKVPNRLTDIINSLLKMNIYNLDRRKCFCRMLSSLIFLFYYNCFWNACGRKIGDVLLINF